CDTFGETELEAALRAGVPPTLISVNGASKSTALIRRAVAAGARITLDSGRELPIAEKAAADAGTTARVRIRLRPRLDGLHATSAWATAGWPRGAVGLRKRRHLDPRGVSVLEGRRPHRRRRGAGTCRAGFAAHRIRWSARPSRPPDRGRQPLARADRKLRRFAC